MNNCLYRISNFILLLASSLSHSEQFCLFCWWTFHDLKSFFHPYQITAGTLFWLAPLFVGSEAKWEVKVNSPQRCQWRDLQKEINERESWQNTALYFCNTMAHFQSTLWWNQIDLLSVKEGRGDSSSKTRTSSLVLMLYDCCVKKHHMLVFGGFCVVSFTGLVIVVSLWWPCNSMVWKDVQRNNNTLTS